MKKYNESITRNGPVTVHGVPVVVDGHSFTYSGHYTDRIDLDGKRHIWEWYDIVRDDGRIVGRVSPYISDERIAALFVRLYRTKDPEGFNWACRWPWKPATHSIEFDDGHVETFNTREERKPVNITIPADIIEETRLQLDDEIRVEVYSVGPEPVQLGRRLFHLSKTGKSFVIPLTKLSNRTRSTKYDGDAGQPLYRKPSPGEPVALVVTYDLRTGRRELADDVHQTEDVREDLREISDYIEELADFRLWQTNEIIRDVREREQHRASRSYQDTTQYVQRLEEDERKESRKLKAVTDPEKRREIEEFLAFARDALERERKRLEELPRRIEMMKTDRQAEPERPRTDRWPELVGEWVEKPTDKGFTVANDVLGVSRTFDVEEFTSRFFKGRKTPGLLDGEDEDDPDEASE